MKEKFIEGKTYKLPGALTPFQEEMYVHLINWKWGKNIKEPGIYQKKDDDSDDIGPLFWRIWGQLQFYCFHGKCA